MSKVKLSRVRSNGVNTKPVDFYKLVKTIKRDGKVTEKERADLKETIQKVIDKDVSSVSERNYTFGGNVSTYGISVLANKYGSAFNVGEDTLNFKYQVIFCQKVDGKQKCGGPNRITDRDAYVDKVVSNLLR